MAAADYTLCEVCGNKAFYDAHLNYEEVKGHPGYRPDAPGIKLDRCGDTKTICEDCAKTHEVVVRAKMTTPNWPTDEDVEKAARAICDEEWNGTQPPFDRKPPSFGKRYRTWARAALLAAQPPSAVPEGWRLVPVEPTEAMLAPYRGLYRTRISRDTAARMWREMLAVASPPPSQTRAALKELTRLTEEYGGYDAEMGRAPSKPQESAEVEGLVEALKWLIAEMTELEGELEENFYSVGNARAALAAYEGRKG